MTFTGVTLLDEEINILLTFIGIAAAVGASVAVWSAARQTSGPLWPMVGRSCLGSTIGSGIVGLITAVAGESGPDALVSAPIFFVIAAVLGLPVGLMVSVTFGFYVALSRGSQQSNAIDDSAEVGQAN